MRGVFEYCPYSGKGLVGRMGGRQIPLRSRCNSYQPHGNMLQAQMLQVQMLQVQMKSDPYLTATPSEHYQLLASNICAFKPRLKVVRHK